MKRLTLVRYLLSEAESRRGQLVLNIGSIAVANTQILLFGFTALVVFALVSRHTITSGNLLKIEVGTSGDFNNNEAYRFSEETVSRLAELPGIVYARQEFNKGVIVNKDNSSFATVAYATAPADPEISGNLLWGSGVSGDDVQEAVLSERIANSLELRKDGSDIVEVMVTKTVNDTEQQQRRTYTVVGVVSIPERPSVVYLPHRQLQFLELWSADAIADATSLDAAAPALEFPSALAVGLALDDSSKAQLEEHYDVVLESLEQMRLPRPAAQLPQLRVIGPQSFERDDRIGLDTAQAVENPVRFGQTVVDGATVNVLAVAPSDARLAALKLVSGTARSLSSFSTVVVRETAFGSAAVGDALRCGTGDFPALLTVGGIARALPGNADIMCSFHTEEFLRYEVPLTHVTLSVASDEAHATAIASAVPNTRMLRGDRVATGLPAAHILLVSPCTVAEFTTLVTTAGLNVPHCALSVIEVDYKQLETGGLKLGFVESIPAGWPLDWGRLRQSDRRALSTSVTVKTLSFGELRYTVARMRQPFPEGLALVPKHTLTKEAMYAAATLFDNPFVLDAIPAQFDAVDVMVKDPADYEVVRQQIPTTFQVIELQQPQIDTWQQYRVLPVAGTHLSEQVVAALSQDRSFESVEPQLTVDGKLGTVEATFDAAANQSVFRKAQLLSGSLVDDRATVPQVVLSQATAAFHRGGDELVGKKVQITFSRPASFTDTTIMVTATVVGITASEQNLMNASQLKHIALWQKGKVTYTERNGFVSGVDLYRNAGSSRFKVYVSDLQYIQPVVDHYRQAGYEVISSLDKLESIKWFGLLLTLLVIVTTIVVTGTAVALVFIVTLQNTKSRLYEMAIMRAFGAPNFLIYRLFFWQGATIGTVAFALCEVLSAVVIMIVGALLPRLVWDQRLAQELTTELGNYGLFQQQFLWLHLTIWVISVCGSVAAVLVSARYASRSPISTAFQER